MKAPVELLEPTSKSGVSDVSRFVTAKVPVVRPRDVHFGYGCASFGPKFILAGIGVVHADNTPIRFIGGSGNGCRCKVHHPTCGGGPTHIRVLHPHLDSVLP